MTCSKTCLFWSSLGTVKELRHAIMTGYKLQVFRTFSNPPGPSNQWLNLSFDKRLFPEQIGEQKTRILAVLAYNSEPNISLSETSRMTFYGRLD